MSYASVYEQTHSWQCCNLFIAWLSTQPVIVLPSVARACDDQSTVHLDWQLGGYSSARVCNVWEFNVVLFRISIWFSCKFAGFCVANRAVIDVCYYCADVWSVLAHFGSEYSGTRPSTGRSGYRSSTACVYRIRDAIVDRPISCLHSTVGARLRLVAHCSLVRNSPQTTVCGELWPVITLQTQCWR